MASYDYGKTAVVDKIMYYDRTYFSSTTEVLSILDVGTCDGKWADLLHDAYIKANMVVAIDGIEAFKPNAARCLDKYDNMFVGSAVDYQYPRGMYDIVIFGDVLEHMAVCEAQYCVEYAIERVRDIIVGVPFLYPQGPIYGNPFERHIQDDLTLEVMAKRYPDLELLLQPTPNYAYYHAKGGPLK